MARPRNDRATNTRDERGGGFIVADILSDRAGRAVTFGLDNPLITRFWTAVKTGTSKDWFSTEKHSEAAVIPIYGGPHPATQRWHFRDGTVGCTIR